MVLFISATFIALVLGLICWAIAPLRKPAPILSTTKILDREGNLLYEVGREEGLRTIVSLDKVAPSFIQALIASEDQRFYDHRGVDWRATIRAAKDLVLRREIVSGASTLEQQLIKLRYFPTAPRSFFQKMREAIAARYWSVHHTKQETVTEYINTVFFGNRAHGVEAAARVYFHASAEQLSLAQSAFLVGVLPAPSAYDPVRSMAKARIQQRRVLDRMVERGMITGADRDSALEAPVEIFSPRHDIQAPHFVFHVLDELEARYPSIREGGYTVRTTLDPDLQRYAHDTINRRLLDLADENVNNAAFLAMSPQTGEVLAYVGSKEYFLERIQGKVDMVTAKRQPGSALKPFLYMQAFMQGMTPATVVADTPVRFTTAEGRSYYPRNYNYRYYGPVSLREALGSSLNIPAVKVLDRVGLASFVGFLSRFGIRFPESADHYGLGVVLGGGETSLWEVTNAYASLALHGRSVNPQMILEVRDTGGRVIEKVESSSHADLFENPKLARQAAWLVTDVLSDKTARARSFGEANLLDVGAKVAVKTGTTKDFRDNWTFGYTPEITMGVWVGNADNAPMEGVSGITGAVPIWHDVMRYYVKRHGSVVWPTVSGLSSRAICSVSGKLTNGTCPKTRTELFIEGTEPKEVDDWYVKMEIDAATGLRATPRCRSRIVSKIFLQPPPEYAAWMSVNGYEVPPVRDCEGNSLPLSGAPLIVLSPLDGDTFVSEGLLDAANMRIPFLAGGQRRSIYRWKLNGQIIESSDPTYLWQSRPGAYTLELEGGDRVVRFQVQ